LNDGLPDIFITEFLIARTQHLLDFFGGDLPIAVLVKMLKSLGKSVFLKNLVLVHAGDLPFAEINETIAV
jgi:hypothetical protein